MPNVRLFFNILFRSEYKLNESPPRPKKNAPREAKNVAPTENNSYSSIPGGIMSISFFEKISLRICRRKDKKIKLWDACDRMIDQKMSIDHIMTSLNEFDKFHKVAMTDYEMKMFNSMRALYVEEHEEIMNRRMNRNVKVKEINSQNENSGLINRMIEFTKVEK